MPWNQLSKHLSLYYSIMAVAVFDLRNIKGTVLFRETRTKVIVSAFFTKLPPGEHGFHIHEAGDLREKGCMGACSHFDNSEEPQNHGGPPGTPGQRHTGDLGNISLVGGKCEQEYILKGVQLSDLYGRSMIVHADKDDYGLGGFEDSLKTGHAGARLACAIIGRAKGC